MDTTGGGEGEGGGGGRGLYLGLFIYLCDWTWQREQSHRLPRGDVYPHFVFPPDRQRSEVRGQRTEVISRVHGVQERTCVLNSTNRSQCFFLSCHMFLKMCFLMF